jgi:hypothetical protein
MRPMQVDFFFNSRTQAFLTASCNEALTTVAELKKGGGSASLAFHEANEDSDLQVSQVRERAEALSRGDDGCEHLLLVLPIKLQAVELIARSIVLGADRRLGWVFIHQGLPAKLIEQEPDLRRRLVWSVGADQEEMGRLQARQLQRLFPADQARQVGVVYMQGPIHSSATYRRSSGFRQQLAHTPHIAIQTQMLFAPWTKESAVRALQVAGVERLLTFTRAAVAHNDEMAIGIRDYFGPRGRSDLAFLGMDGLGSFGRAKVDTGELNATVVQPLCVREAIHMFAKLAMPEAMTEPQRRRTRDVDPCVDVVVPPTSYPPLEELRPLTDLVPAVRRQAS